VAHRPSRSLQSHLNDALGEKEYLAGMYVRQNKLEKVSRAVQSTFGVAMVDALTNIEQAGMSALVNVPSWHIFKVNKLKAEIQTARFVRSKLLAYVTNHEAFTQELQRFNDDSES